MFDGAIAAYLLAPTDGSYELDKLGAQYFQKTLPPAKEYLGAKVWKDAAGAQAAGQVMASHAALLFALYALLPEKLAAFGLTKVYEDIELPLCPVLAEMERAGMLVDAQALAPFGAGLTAGIAALQEEIWAQAGEEFNLNSTQQLGRVLFEQLGLPPVKKTKTGYSTSAEVLEKLRPHHPIIDLILEYRQLTKLNSTYVEGLSRSLPGRADSHLLSKTPSPPPDGSLPPSPTFRTSPCARSWGRSFGRCSCPAGMGFGGCGLLPRLSSASWPTWRGDEKMIEPPSAPGRISTPARPLRSLVCRWRRSLGSYAAGPRR